MTHPLNERCHTAFLRAAWGEDDPERRREIEQARYDVLALDHPQGLAQFDNALRQGRHAHELWQQLKKKLATHGDGETVQTWLEKTRQHSAIQVFQHVTLQLEKWRQHQKAQRQKAQQQRKGRTRQGPAAYCSTLAPVTLNADGQHPSSLASLLPAPRWEVLIDETGKAFDSSAEQAFLNDPALGRVVAIVKAHNARLPELPARFHGKEEPPEAVDRALAQVLATPQVGIFGFTVKDRIAVGSYWMNHVAQLVRWILYMLPVYAGDPTRVVAHIEQRGGYTPNDERLYALAQTLEGELKALDPARFAGLQLTLDIVPKEHPYLAYADAVAYTWGSPAPISADRLKKSGLLGPCLLHPVAGEEGLAHLYQALVYQDQLPADQWYALCAAAEDDGPNGLLARWLARLGEKVQKERDHWQRLLNEVQQRLRAKDVSLVTLSAALAWLERFMPAETTLSGELKLAFVSAQLALANHHGHVDMNALKTLLALSPQLEDENAPAVCQALLRAAITTTNHFEFAAMVPMLHEWVEKPMAIPGRLNHVKLHSTLGQLAAFEQRHEDAEVHFNQALVALAPLSDPQQAARERQQTRSYQMIARLDTPSRPLHAQRDDLKALLRDATGRQDLPGVARRFAAGGSGSEVYLHHLLLRACLAYPDTFQDATQAYLGQSHAWQWHTGHPWGLIHAYRGWLLLQADKTDTAHAEKHFHAALDRCFATASGITLHWMGAVLHALATSLLPAFHTDVPAHARPETLARTLPAAPHSARDALAALPTDAPHAQRWAQLGECLPFNFH